MKLFRSRIYYLLTVILIPMSVVGSVQQQLQDTEIRILVVVDGNASQSRVNAQLAYLQNAWANTVFQSIYPTTYSIVGQETIAPGTLVGDGVAQLDEIEDFVEGPIDPLDPQSMSIRSYYGADVVIGFSPDVKFQGISVCGRADQQYWGGPVRTFLQDANNLDLRGRFEDYSAVVSTSTSVCPDDNTAVHELGHLLGGGHTYHSGRGLEDHSRAYIQVDVIDDFPFPIVIALRSVMSYDVDIDCNQAPNCILVPTFSDYVFGTSVQNNAKTFDRTARSVANYIGGGPPEQPVAMCSDGMDNDGDSLVDSNDPDCATGDDENGPPPPPPPNCNSTVAPTNLSGYLVQVCVPGTSATQYQALWLHPCPATVTSYEIWKSQPYGVPYIYGWTRITPFSDVFVEGATGSIKVRSCGPAGCSALSSSKFIAVDQC